MIVDAHQHFWQEDAPFLTPEWGHLSRTFAPKDLAPLLAAAGVDGTVAVQSDHSYGDTELLLRHADEHDFVKGVVGWVPLLDFDETTRAIARFSRHRRFCGVRHLIHMLPDPDWILQEALVPSFKLLAEHGLVFEAVSVTPKHLENVSHLADRVPDLTIVVDHLSKPPILERGWDPWATLLARAAEHPNVYSKLSGLNTAADHLSWTAADLRPYVAHALSVFGPDRLMFGSDWPILTLAGNYERVWRATCALLDHLGGSELGEVLGGTAVRCYGLDVPG